MAVTQPFWLASASVQTTWTQNHRGCLPVIESSLSLVTPGDTFQSHVSHEVRRKPTYRRSINKSMILYKANASVTNNGFLARRTITIWNTSSTHSSFGRHLVWLSLDRYSGHRLQSAYDPSWLWCLLLVLQKPTKGKYKETGLLHSIHTCIPGT